jgi:hypothetical protein
MSKARFLPLNEEEQLAELARLIERGDPADLKRIAELLGMTDDVDVPLAASSSKDQDR